MPNIAVFSSQRDLPVQKSRVRALVLFLFAHFRVECEEISVHLVSQKKISVLHAEFFDDPTPTDCITFPLDSYQAKGPGTVLGEVFICPRVAIAYAAQHNLNPYEETSRYLIHAFLHLLGYDDTTPRERASMRTKERSLLRLAHAKNLLLGAENGS